MQHHSSRIRDRPALLGQRQGGLGAGAARLAGAIFGQEVTSRLV